MTENTILENLNNHKYQRLWLTMGEAHGQYSASEYVEAVTHLYASLKNENVNDYPIFRD